jgi:hypothetical protein
MSQTKKTKVPHLKLIVNNGSLIDEELELLEMQKALIANKINIQQNINILRNSMEPIDEKIQLIEKQLDNLRGNNNDKRKSWEIRNPWTSGDKD